jgi:hypothetical protein
VLARLRVISSELINSSEIFSISSKTYAKVEGCAERGADFGGLEFGGKRGQKK